MTATLGLAGVTASSQLNQNNKAALDMLQRDNAATQHIITSDQAELQTIQQFMDTQSKQDKSEQVKPKQSSLTDLLSKRDKMKESLDEELENDKQETAKIDELKASIQQYPKDVAIQLLTTLLSVIGGATSLNLLAMNQKRELRYELHKHINSGANHEETYQLVEKLMAIKDLEQLNNMLKLELSLLQDAQLSKDYQN